MLAKSFYWRLNKNVAPCGGFRNGHFYFTCPDCYRCRGNCTWQSDHCDLLFPNCVNQWTRKRAFSQWWKVPTDLNACGPRPWKRVVKTQQLLGLAWDTWCVVRHIISPEAPDHHAPHPGTLCTSLDPDESRNTVKRPLTQSWSYLKSSRVCTQVRKRETLVWWSHGDHSLMKALKRELNEGFCDFCKKE